MEFDKLVNKLLMENDSGLASRVARSSNEVRDLAKRGKVNPMYHGGAFYYDDPDPSMKYMPTPKKWEKGEKLGYVLRADREKMRSPVIRGDESMNLYKNSWTDKLNKDLSPEEKARIGKEYYERKKYLQLPTDSPSSDVKTVQRIRYNPEKQIPWDLGKERDFGRFQQIYNKLVKAFEEGKIRVRPPRINPTMGTAGIAAIMQFLNDEVPPDIRNSMMSGMSGGGYGIKGKFEAIP